MQHGLDIVGVDIHAATDDHLLLPADDVEVAVLVQVAQVSAVQPATPPHLRGGHGVLVVLAVPGGIAGDDLTDLAGRAGHPGVVDDADLHRVPRPAYSARPGTRALRVHAEGRVAAFGHSVAVEHRRVGHLALQPPQ